MPAADPPSHSEAGPLTDIDRDISYGVVPRTLKVTTCVGPEKNFGPMVGIGGRPATCGGGAVAPGGGGGNVGRGAGVGGGRPVSLSTQPRLRTGLFNRLGYFAEFQ